MHHREATGVKPVAQLWAGHGFRFRPGREVCNDIHELVLTFDHTDTTLFITLPFI